MRCAAARRRLSAVLDRLGGMLEATHARPRLVLAPHPAGRDARCVLDRRGPPGRLGAAADDLDELEARTGRGAAPRPAAASSAPMCRRRRSTRCGSLGGWLASHPDTPQLALDAGADRDRLDAFSRTPVAAPRPAHAGAGAARAPGSGSAGGLIGRVGHERQLDDDPPGPASGPTCTGEPGGASRRTMASATAPSPGESATLPSVPTERPPKLISAPSRPGPPAACRAAGGWACRGRRGGRPSPGPRSSPW